MPRNREETIQSRRESGYYSELGKRGFDATTVKYFDGDRVSASIWLRSKGKIAERRRPWETYPFNLPAGTPEEESRHNNKQ